MKCFALTFALTGIVLFTGHAVGAREKDTVYFRQQGKKQDDIVSGTIQEESPAGIKLKTEKGDITDIPSLQIRAVDYGEGIDIVGKVDYRAGDTKLDRALLETTGKKKRDGLEQAMLAFRELDNNDKLRRILTVHRYLQYRLVQTAALLARDDASRRDTAFTALNDYKSAFSDGWEIVPALQLLASLQEDKGETEAASKTYSELSDLPGIAASLKFQSQLKGARLLMLAPKFREAEEKLKLLEAAMPAGDPQRAVVEVYLMQARIAQKGNLDGMAKKLEQIVAASKDGRLRALAHNVLGDYYRLKGDETQAFWEYCKVDMLYNQDKEEHAKALYYLAQLFDKPPRNHPARAEEVLTRLKSPQFDGTLYQRLAAAEKKKGDEK
ncbi:MAG: tetratricopeptide repeat protein [Gemmataceae bacterium]